MSTSKNMWWLLGPYIEKGLIAVRKHSTENLWIADYTQKCQFDQAWDDVTLNTRGVVFDVEGKVVAHGFPKFFNLSELASRAQWVPSGEFEIAEKLDGSFGMLFTWEGKHFLTTRGSFDSEQAIRGAKILAWYGTSWIDPELTYCFEIIYPENRIVLDYKGREDLVLIGAFRGDTELHIHELTHPLLVPKRSFSCDIGQLPVIPDDEEGYVLKWSNGFRCKVKGDEYLRLHRIHNGLTARNVWQLLVDDTTPVYSVSNLRVDELRKSAAEEYSEWIRTTANQLAIRFDKVLSHHWIEYQRITAALFGIERSKHINGLTVAQKKAFAQAVEATDVSINNAILFSMLQGRDVTDTIWEMLYPPHEVAQWNEIN